VRHAADYGQDRADVQACGRNATVE
jgi:hypothetical protein